MSDTIARAALSRMNLREQAVARHYQEGFASDLAQMARTDPTVAREKFMSETRVELCEAYGLGRPQQSKPYAFANGFAIIPVHGSLINRFGSSYGYVTGYNFIRAQHMAALLDEDVKYIVHDHNSYGGEAAGCFELSDEIYASRGTKPIVAVVDSNCYSASYALASACDRIIVIPSAGVGSVGVVAMHINMKKMLDNFGVEITFIHSGDHKVDGNPYEALSPEVKADIQKNVDKSRAKFVTLVARNLGLDSKIIYDTEARTYRADDALKLGLVKAIAVPSAALQSIIDEDAADNSDDSQDDGQDEQISTPKPEEEMTMDPTQGNNTPAAGQPAVAVQQQAANSTDIQKAERARVSGILNCEEAKGREQQANYLALSTSMSVDEAKAILAVAPTAAAAPAVPAAGASAFETAMNNTAHPNVGADSVAGAGAAAGKEPTADERAAAIMSSYAMASGRSAGDEK
jgi:signal peptide peptidase SppA